MSAIVPFVPVQILFHGEGASHVRNVFNSFSRSCAGVSAQKRFALFTRLCAPFTFNVTYVLTKDYILCFVAVRRISPSAGVMIAVRRDATSPGVIITPITSRLPSEGKRFTGNRYDTTMCSQPSVGSLSVSEHTKVSIKSFDLKAQFHNRNKTKIIITNRQRTDFFITDYCLVSDKVGKPVTAVTSSGCLVTFFSTPLSRSVELKTKASCSPLPSSRLLKKKNHRKPRTTFNVNAFTFGSLHFVDGELLNGEPSVKNVHRSGREAATRNASNARHAKKTASTPCAVAAVDNLGAHVATPATSGACRTPLGLEASLEKAPSKTTVHSRCGLLCATDHTIRNCDRSSHHAPQLSVVVPSLTTEQYKRVHSANGVTFGPYLGACYNSQLPPKTAVDDFIRYLSNYNPLHNDFFTCLTAGVRREKFIVRRVSGRSSVALIRQCDMQVVSVVVNELYCRVLRMRTTKTIDYGLLRMHKASEGFCYLNHLWFICLTGGLNFQRFSKTFKHLLGRLPRVFRFVNLLASFFSSGATHIAVAGKFVSRGVFHVDNFSKKFFSLRNMGSSLIGGGDEKEQKKFLDSYEKDQLINQIVQTSRGSKDSIVLKNVEMDLSNHADAMRRIMREKPSLRVPFQLNETQQAMVSRAYPNYDLIFTNTSFSDHPMAAASRLMENITLSDFCENDYADVGGCPKFHYEQTPTHRVHVCRPVLDSKDAQRRVLRNFELEKDSLKRNVDVGDLTSMKNNLTSCSKVVGACHHKVRSMMLVQVYDVDLYELCNAMVTNEAKVAYLTMITPGEILDMREAFRCDIINCDIELDSHKNILTYKFGSSCYTHSLSTVRKYMTSPVVVIGQYLFSIEMTGVRCGVNYYVITKSEVAPMIRTDKVIRFRRCCQDITKITLPRFCKKTRRCLPGVETIYVDSKFVNRVHEYIVGNCNTINSKTFEWAWNFVKSSKSRVVISGKIIHRDVSISMEHLEQFVVVMLAAGVRSRSTSEHLAKNVALFAGESSLLDVAKFALKELLARAKRSVREYMNKTLKGFFSDVLLLEFLDLDDSISDMEEYSEIRVRVETNKFGELVDNESEILVANKVERDLALQLFKEEVGKIKYSHPNKSQPGDSRLRPGLMGGSRDDCSSIRMLLSYIKSFHSSSKAIFSCFCSALIDNFIKFKKGVSKTLSKLLAILNSFLKAVKVDYETVNRALESLTHCLASSYSIADTVKVLLKDLYSNVKLTVKDSHLLLQAFVNACIAHKDSGKYKAFKNKLSRGYEFLFKWSNFDGEIAVAFELFIVVFKRCAYDLSSFVSGSISANVFLTRIFSSVLLEINLNAFIAHYVGEVDSLKKEFFIRTLSDILCTFCHDGFSFDLFALLKLANVVPSVLRSFLAEPFNEEYDSYFGRVKFGVKGFEGIIALKEFAADSVDDAIKAIGDRFEKFFVNLVSRCATHFIEKFMEEAGVNKVTACYTRKKQRAESLYAKLRKCLSDLFSRGDNGGDDGGDEFHDSISSFEPGLRGGSAVGGLRDHLRRGLRYIHNLFNANSGVIGDRVTSFIKAFATSFLDYKIFTFFRGTQYEKVCFYLFELPLNALVICGVFSSPTTAMVETLKPLCLASFEYVVNLFRAEGSVGSDDSDLDINEDFCLDAEECSDSDIGDLSMTPGLRGGGRTTAYARVVKLLLGIAKKCISSSVFRTLVDFVMSSQVSAMLRSKSMTTMGKALVVLLCLIRPQLFIVTIIRYFSSNFPKGKGKPKDGIALFFSKTLALENYLYTKSDANGKTFIGSDRHTPTFEPVEFTPRIENGLQVVKPSENLEAMNASRLLLRGIIDEAIRRSNSQNLTHETPRAEDVDVPRLSANPEREHDSESFKGPRIEEVDVPKRSSKDDSESEPPRGEEEEVAQLLYNVDVPSTSNSPLPRKLERRRGICNFLNLQNSYCSVPTPYLPVSDNATTHRKCCEAIREFYFLQEISIFSLHTKLATYFHELNCLSFSRAAAKCDEDVDLHVYNSRSCKVSSAKGKLRKLREFDDHEFCFTHEGLVLNDPSSRVDKLFHESTKFLASNSFLRSYENHKNAMFTNTNVDIKLYEAPPGGGKTHTLIQLYLMYSAKCRVIVVTANKNSQVDILNKLKNSTDLPTSVKPDCDVFTLDSYLMNHLNERCTVLMVDECFMVHSGQVLMCINSTVCNVAVLYGDTRQIHYIERCELIKPKYSDLENFVPPECRTYGHVSFRCPWDVCCWLSEVYSSKIMTVKASSVGKSSVTVVPTSAVEDVPIDSSSKYVTFTQSEKQELQRLVDRTLGCGVSVVNTVHEVQGETFERVKLVRNKFQEDSPFMSQNHVIVALSRHVESLHYYVNNARVYDDTSRAIGRMHDIAEKFATFPKNFESSYITMDVKGVHEDNSRCKALSAPFDSINAFLEEVVVGSTTVNLDDISSDLSSSPFESGADDVTLRESSVNTFVSDHTEQRV
uniref:Polyprotein 1a n=1 Tax=Carnation necrotic fleck virus TaxID=551454 RepID=A0A4P2X5S8_9CLOS|nr:polyprotein 1a [Carnation necrotic fleck virus]